MLLQEIIEFWDKLEQMAESEKATIQGPGWSLYGGRGGCVIVIAFAAEKDNALAYRLLPRVWLGIKISDRGV